MQANGRSTEAQRGWKVTAVSTLTVALLARGHAAAQSGPTCPPSWAPTFGAADGVGDTVRSMAVFDDGSGPALYVGGDFTTAGGLLANHIAKWDGSQWSTLGAGTNVAPGAMLVFDDGSGPALYVARISQAGGQYVGGIARWNGTSWSDVGGGPGGGGPIEALAVFDDGTGPALYAGGSFFTATSSYGIAKWDGAAWSDVSAGMWGDVYALAVFDDGTGAKLYVGGYMPSYGMYPQNITAWDGANWHFLGTGTNGTVRTLVVHDDGTGAALFVGGGFNVAGGVQALRVAKWNGSAWSALSSGLSASAGEMLTFDDGNGPQLYAIGNFNVGGITRWNGSAWSNIGANFNGTIDESLRVFDDGNGPALYAGGNFSTVGSVAARRIVRWRGGQFSPLGGTGLNSGTLALATFDSGNGPELYAGGPFSTAGGAPLNCIARWNGATWLPLGSGVMALYDASVNVLRTFDDGGGEKLYVGGNFTSAGGAPANYLATWNGAAWAAVPGPLNGRVFALCEFDDGQGPALYVGGTFTTVAGLTVNCVAKWNGSQWSALGSGVSSYPSTFAKVFALTVHDDGSGPALYVTGDFITAGGASALRIARWNGSQWSALGSGFDNYGLLLCVFDDGAGPALFAGGYFTVAGGTAVPHIARWSGGQWSALAMGATTLYGPQSMITYDDGSGTALYVGGGFQNAGGSPTTGVARWNGSTWSGLGGGLSSSANAFTVLDDGVCPGRSLIVGGGFASAPDSGDSYVARWGCPTQSCHAGLRYCTAGTTSNGCVPSISGAGVASASASSGFTLSVAQLEGQRSGHFFYGINGPLANPWSASSSSYLCVRAPTQRMGTQSTGGTYSACDGTLAQDWNAFRAGHPTSLGQPFAAGATVWVQAWFRDPPAPKTTNLSDALTILVAP